MSESFSVIQIPAFEDNYLYLLRGQHPDQVIAVDPGDGEVIEAYLQQQNLQLAAIWNTHHHPDHTGGNLLLAERHGCHIYGPDKESSRIPGISHPLKDGDLLEMLGLSARILWTPGHTLGAICYFLEAQQILFCGDTLFAMGCGRLFEGTPEQMWQSLQRIAELSDETLVYCAHEYTLANSRFAVHAEPGNQDLLQRVQQVQQMRQENLPTVPTTVGLEKKTNPFMRAECGLFEQKYQRSLAVETFRALRSGKDVF